jgi:hypothetical protein
MMVSQYGETMKTMKDLKGDKTGIFADTFIMTERYTPGSRKGYR